MWMSIGFVANTGVRTGLLSGVCLLALVAGPVQAQNAASNQQTESITVTGLINSLQRNLDIKRDASGLVDAISAEDVGKFPDVDIAAALQHVPGVTVSRSGNNGTQNGITVRGFGPAFNQTLFDGRQTSTTSGRNFNFSDVGADFVSEVDVNKTPDASMSSGAIGATVNIKYPKPFDHPGLRIVGALSASASDNLGNPLPAGDLLVSDTFDNDRFGILAAISYSSFRNSDNHLNTNGWQGNYVDPCQLATATVPCGPTLTPDTSRPIWYMQEYQLFHDITQETRYEGRLALQWHPADSVLVTVNDNYSNHYTTTTNYGFSTWFNQGDLRKISTSKFGTITSFSQPNKPTDLDAGFGRSIIQNNEYGVNVNWQATDQLSVMVDAAQGLSQSNPGRNLTSLGADVGYGPSTPAGTNGVDTGVVVPGGHALAYPANFGPNGNQSLVINNGILGSHVLTMGVGAGTDKVQQIKAEAVWKEGDDFTIVAGYQYVGKHHNSSSYDDFGNNDWQAYAGYGPASNNNGTHGVVLPQSLFTQSISTADFINGWTQTAIPPVLPKYSAFAVLNYLQGLGNPQTTVIPGFNTGCCNPAFDGVFRNVLNVGSVESVIENTNAAYIQVSAGAKVADMPLRINLGVRQEFTNVTTIGIGRLPLALTVQPSDHTAFQTSFGPQTNVSGKNSYQYLLPNLDIALQITDDLQLRLDASRTLTRPGLTQITPVLNVPTGPRVGSLTANGGNPNLMPYLSDNLDATGSWYYQPNSYVSLNVFNKTVTNFIVAGTKQDQINGVIDPTTGQPAIWTISANVNGPTANVYGAEIGWQHVFGDTGWGFQVNGTVVGTNKPYNPNDLSKSGFAVTGLADSANVVGFYDLNGFQARVALTWNDTVLDRFGQTQNNSKFGAEPTFVNANTHVDFSTSYDITEQLNVFLTAQNLTDATMSTRGRWSDQVLDVFDYGRRFSIGLHFKY